MSARPDFELTPHCLQYPKLFAQVQRQVEQLQQQVPLTPHTIAILQEYYNFHVTPVLPRVCRKVLGLGSAAAIYCSMLSSRLGQL